MEKLEKKYENILKDSLSDKPMEGPPYEGTFKKEALKKVYTLKRCRLQPNPPLHLKPAAIKTLADTIKNKLIKEVPVNKLFEWCSRGFLLLNLTAELDLLLIFHLKRLH